MVSFALVDGVLLAEGHGHTDAELRAGVAAALADRGGSRAARDAEGVTLSEAWHNSTHGWGHDCSLHLDVDRSLWSPGCFAGGFRPVTVATNVPAVPAVQRARVGGSNR